jgi:hypothetical protein
MSEKEVSIWEIIKTVIKKSTLANISAFIILMALTKYAVEQADGEILQYIGFTAFGYLYGVSRNGPPR